MTDTKSSNKPPPLKYIRLENSSDVVRARQFVAHEMKKHGVSAIKVTRFATAVSEIARNAVVHGGGGEFRVFLDRSSGYLKVECSDHGKGIEDIQQAMTDGFTTGGGLGKGLGGAERLSDTFEIASESGRGTLVKLSAKI